MSCSGLTFSLLRPYWFRRALMSRNTLELLSSTTECSSVDTIPSASSTCDDSIIERSFVTTPSTSSSMGLSPCFMWPTR